MEDQLSQKIILLS